MVTIQHRYAEVDGHQIFYREAGPADAPTVVLLHGYPTSSHMFRTLIPQLAEEYHVVAPDHLGFGLSDAPGVDEFDYSFDALARITSSLLAGLGITRYAIYVQDYGAPIGWRLALENPSAITAIISQNGNAYEEGLSEGWADMRTAWASPTVENREALRRFNTPDMVRWQYTEGVEDASLIAPETYQLASAAIARIGVEPQMDLMLDYGSNVRQYPQLHAFFRQYQPPTLAIWGRNDPFFLPAGAEAFRRDNPDAEVRLLDTGHFAIETHGGEIAAAMLEFLDRNIAR